MGGERKSERAKQPLEIRTPKPNNMIREVKQEGRVSLSASTRVVDVDYEFSWC